MAGKKIEIDVDSGTASNVFTAGSRGFGDIFGMSRAVCPVCGKKGEFIPEETVAAMTEGSMRRPAEGIRYLLCRTSSCNVTYYPEKGGDYFEKTDIAVPLWFKDNDEDIPVCYCHGISGKDIREARLKGASTFAEVMEHFGRSTISTECRIKNPCGCSCSGDIARYIVMLESENPEAGGP